MGKKRSKRDMDKQLLNAIFTVEEEWKQIQTIVDESIDPSDMTLYRVSLEQAKYMFLLKEARHRNISAVRY